MIPTIKNPRQTKTAGLILVAFYVCFRMIADPFFWRDISEYYAYAFEIAFVSITWMVYRKQIKLWSKPSQKDFILASISLVFGVLIYRAASWINVPIPFDLTLPMMIFLLLIFSPLLEEAIFRLALWQALKSVLKSDRMVILSTTLLFAAGHLAAYWFVPEQFQGFVLYQTFYVLFLGFMTGKARTQSQGMFAPLLVHFSFNVGFFLASLA